MAGPFTFRIVAVIVVAQGFSPAVCSVDASVHPFGDRPPRAPIILDDRVEDLVEILSVTEERLPENGFLHCARFEQRPVAAAVQHGGPRF